MCHSIEGRHFGYVKQSINTFRHSLSVTLLNHAPSKFRAILYCLDIRHVIIVANIVIIVGNCIRLHIMHVPSSKVYR
jgi:hypothetical protein